MSYTPVFAPDAESEWRALEIRFQEHVLDEVERLCHSAPTEIETVSELIVSERAIRHFLFVRVITDARRQTITVAGVGYCSSR